MFNNTLKPFHLFVFFLVITTTPFAKEKADSVYVNGRIYTVDDNYSWAEAVAIKGERIIAVGKDQEIQKFIGRGTTVTDLDGNMAMPGIHDAHTHYLMAGYGLLFECTLQPANSLDALAKKLEGCRSKVRSDPSWLTINAEFDPVHVEGFDRKFLDKIYPDVAVVVRDFTLHNVFVNSRTLELTGLNKNTPDPEGGHIMHDPVTGQLTGLFVEAAKLMVERRIPGYSSIEQETAVRHVLDIYRRAGVTSVQDAGMTQELLSILGRLERKNELTQYVFGHIVGVTSAFFNADMALLNNRKHHQSPLIDVNAMKVWLDGVPFPPHLTHVPLKEDGSIDKSNLLVAQNVLNEKVLAWDKLGLRIKLHAVGEGSVRVALNAFEQARIQNGHSDLLHEVVHSMSISEQDMKRFKQLNVVAEMSPGYGGLANPYDPNMAKVWQYRTLLDNGVLMTAGSDFPISEPGPFSSLQTIVTRSNESIDLADALTILTRNGAIVTGRQKDLGSIEQGKIANMIVLDQHLFEIPKNDIAKTRVLKTVFRGSVVYDAN